VAGNLETLRFVLFGDDRASSAFSRFARQVDDTTRAVDKNNLSLLDQRAKLDLIAKKAEELGKLNPDVKVQIDDYAAKLKLAVLKHELNSIGGSGGPLSNLGNLSGDAAAGVSGLAKALSGLPGILGSIASTGPVGVAVIVAMAAALVGLAVAAAPITAALIPITIGIGGFAAIAIPELTKVMGALSKSGTAAQTALKNLDPAERDLLAQIRPLKEQFSALAKAVQPDVMKAFGEAIKVIKDFFPAFKPLIKAAADALAGFLGKMDQWLNSPGGQAFVHWLETRGPKDIQMFGRVMWDVAKGIGDALNQIYRAGKWIDALMVRWGDNWMVMKTAAQMIWDEIEISALRMVSNVLGAFSHIPVIGHRFAEARVAVQGEIGKMQADVVRASVEMQGALDRIHGEKITLKFNATTGVIQGIAGHHFAKGTSGAAPGWGWVGEEGPELVKFSGGEKVIPSHVATGYAGGTGWDIRDVFNPAVTATSRQIGSMASGIENNPGKYWTFKWSPGGFGGGSGALGGDAGANKALARQLFPWSATYWPAFVALEMREAGFNRFARNPTSGAYGIPQALPPSKMPFAAQAAGGSHAGPQLSWMYGYIGQRYGNPLQAWAHEAAFNWYDQGGWLPPGLSLAMNGTGRPERVGGGGDIIIQNVTVYANDEGDLVRKLQAYAKRNGPIRLKVRS
jgi:hypothetical protein